MGQVLVFHANDIIEAQIVCGMLEANGVKAWVDGAYLQGAVGELQTMGFARVKVLEADLPQALKILENYNASDVPDVTQDGVWNADPSK